MTPLDQLFWLVVLHFIFDFQLQSDFIARNKSPGSGHVWPWVLSAHATGHAAAVGFVLSPLFGLAEFAVHWLLDFVKARSDHPAKSEKARAMAFHLDQALHIASKLLWLGLALRFPGLLEYRLF